MLESGFLDVTVLGGPFSSRFTPRSWIRILSLDIFGYPVSRYVPHSDMIFVPLMSNHTSTDSVESSSVWASVGVQESAPTVVVGVGLAIRWNQVAWRVKVSAIWRDSAGYASVKSVLVSLLVVYAFNYVYFSPTWPILRVYGPVSGPDAASIRHEGNVGDEKTSIPLLLAWNADSVEQAASKSKWQKLSNENQLTNHAFHWKA